MYKDWDDIRNNLSSITFNIWCDLIFLDGPMDIITQMHNYVDDIDYKPTDDITPLWIAIACDNFDALDYLLKKGATCHLDIPCGDVIVTNHQQITTNQTTINQLVEQTRDLAMFKDFYDLCHF